MPFPTDEELAEFDAALEHATKDSPLTEKAVERLRYAGRTYNDGRVRRFVRQAARARQHGHTEAWATQLHAALGESYPTDHPGYRRSTR